jgi:hypothetical protein
MNDDMPWVNLTQEEVEELRNKKHELTEYGKQKLRELMNKDLIFYTNGKETSRIPSPTLENLTLGTKTPETKLEIEKTMDCEPYPDEFFEEAERREAANRELAKEEWERKERSDTVLRRYNNFYNDECASLPHGTPITPEHMQAMTLECMLDAIRCENLNDEFDVVSIDDINALIEALHQQGNEYLERVKNNG